MNIVFISTMNGYPWGGSEELWYETALYARSLGHDVKAVVFENLPIHRKFDELQQSGIQAFFIGKQNLEIPPLFKRAVLKISKKPIPIAYSNRYSFLKDINPELVVLSQGGSTDITNYNDLKLFFQDLQVPFCLVNHFHHEHGFISTEQKLFLKKLYKKSRKNFFVAERNREVIERQLAFKIPRTAIVKNPVKFESRKVVGYPNKSKPCFAVVARLKFDPKGHDILLQSLSHDRWRERDFEINLYGTGEDEKLVEELIYFYKLQHKAFLKGHVNNVETIWKENHVLILPSLAEGLPLTIVEAMICGRPCLVTDVGDSAVLIENNVNGWIACTSSVNALNEALERAWRQQNDWKQMGEAAHNTAINFIDPHPAKTFFSSIVNAVKKRSDNLQIL